VGDGCGGTPEWAAVLQSGAGGLAVRRGVGRGARDGSGCSTATLEKATTRSLALEKGAALSFFFVGEADGRAALDKTECERRTVVRSVRRSGRPIGCITIWEITVMLFWSKYKSVVLPTSQDICNIIRIPSD
jgi:hypothetical protein